MRRWPGVALLTADRLAIAGLVLLGLCGVSAVFYLLFATSWQRQIVIEAGPKNGVFHEVGSEMQRALSARGLDAVLVNRADAEGVVAEVDDPKGPVNVGFIVQEVDADRYPNVESLGSIAAVPLLIFARRDSVPPRPTIRDLRGLKVQLGPAGTSLNAITYDVLDSYGLADGAVVLQEDQGAVAFQKVLRGESDAAAVLLPTDDIAFREYGANGIVVMVELPQVEALVQSLGYGQPFVVKPGMFSLVDPRPEEAVPTIAMPVTVIADDDLARGNVYAIAEFLQFRFTVSSKGEFPNFVDTQLPVNRYAQELYASGEPWQFGFFPSPVAELLLESAFVLGLLLVLISVWKFFFPDLYRTWDTILRPSRQAGLVSRINRRLAEGRPISSRLRRDLERLVAGMDHQQRDEAEVRRIHAEIRRASHE